MSLRFNISMNILLSLDDIMTANPCLLRIRQVVVIIKGLEVTIYV